MRKTAKKSNKAEFILLIILIPCAVYMISFSSIAYEVPVIEKHMENAGLYRNAKTINQFVVTYMMDPDEESLLELEIFTHEEKMHLLDVKKVFHRVFDILFFSLLWIFCLIWHNHKAAKGKNMGKILVYSGMITAAIALLFAVFPFEAFFSGFHRLLFQQGTWTFPAGSALLQVYPPDFWKSIIFSFFLRGFVTGWILIFAGFLVGKR